MSRTKIREIPTRTGVRTNDAPPPDEVTTATLPASYPTSTPTTDELLLSRNEYKIRELAYFKWQTAGSPESDGVEFWLAAENEWENVAQTED